MIHLMAQPLLAFFLFTFFYLFLFGMYRDGWALFWTGIGEDVVRREDELRTGGYVVKHVCVVDNMYPLIRTKYVVCLYGKHRDPAPRIH